MALYIWCVVFITSFIQSAAAFTTCYYTSYSSGSHTTKTLFCYGNLECCSDDSTKCCEKEEDNTWMIILGAVLGAGILIAIIAGVIFCCIASKKERVGAFPNQGGQIQIVGQIQMQPVSTHHGFTSAEQPPSYQTLYRGGGYPPPPGTSNFQHGADPPPGASHFPPGAVNDYEGDSIMPKKVPLP